MATKKLQILGSLGGNLELDTALTQEGKAADAKAVGDALAGKQEVGDYALKSDIVQADWNQNDETAADYVKNRTHWMGTGLEEFYNGALSFYTNNYDVFGTGHTTVYVNNSVSITTHQNAGQLPESIFIKVNGNLYECPMPNYASIGNGTLSDYKVAMGDSGDYIAVSATYRGHNALYICCTTDLSGADFVLSIDGNRYYPLDERFIPDTIARTADLGNFLPAVTTSNNGQFLCVVDGVWSPTTVLDAEEATF